MKKTRLSKGVLAGLGVVGAAWLGGCADPGADSGLAEEQGEEAAVVAAPLIEGGGTSVTALPVPTLAWAPCGAGAGADLPGLDCAVANVPLDHARPSGAKIGIALARFAAADPAKKIGTVFVNPGGPGGSGVGLVLTGFGEYLGRLLQGKFDVVGFDPRGVGASEPLTCFESADAEAAFLAGAPQFPYLPEQTRPFFQRSTALAARCLGVRAPITAHMSTAEVVRDLDLLRQAVGDRQLSFLGFSYGTYIGNTYANLFPGKVRALVIDGVLDPRLWSRGREIESDRVATAQEFAEFLRLCDEAAADCPLAAPGGAAARYRALADALRLHPLVIDETFTFSYDYLIAYTTSAMYVPELWGGPDGFAALFAALADAVLGDPAAGARAGSLRKSIRERLRRSAPKTAAAYDNGLDAFYGNMCADAQYPSSLAEFRSVGAYAERGSMFGPLWWWQNAPCASWPVAEDRYTGPWTACTSAPVLVVGNLFDGVTSYDGAVASNRLLANSRLLTYAGWGHTAFGRSACVTDYVAAYLLGLELPPPGTVCPANPNPFLSPVSGPASAAARAGAATETAASVPLVGLPPPWLGAR